MKGEILVFKRSMAFILGVCMIATMFVFPAISASAEVMDLTDYEPVPNGTYLDGQLTKITSTTGADYAFGVEVKDLGDNIVRFYNDESKRKKIPNSVTRPEGGYEYKLNTKPVTKGDKLVFVVKVRKANEDDVIPNLILGVADASMGGTAAGWNWKAQTVNSFDITSEEWQTITYEMEIPYNGTVNVVALIGLGIGSTYSNIVKGEELGYKDRVEYEYRPGAAIDVDLNAIFLGKLSAYDINFELSASEAAIGETLTGNASIVDIAGQTDDYDQNFTYYVTDTQGNTVEGFEITEPNVGEVTVKATGAVAPGDYVVLAVSDTYAYFQKTFPIRVVYGDVAKGDGTTIKVTSTKDTVGVTDIPVLTAVAEKDGLPVENTQPYVWTAISGDKMSVCEDITIDVSDDTKTATLSLNLSIAEGSYYIMVNSDSMCTLYEIKVDKSGDIENIVSKIVGGKDDEIATNMETYLAVLELSDSVAASADAQDFASVVTESAKNEDVSAYSTEELKTFFEKNAIVSLYNKNEENIELYDEEGNFVFEKELCLADIDKGDVTIWELFAGTEEDDPLISAEGKEKLFAALTEDGAVSYNDLVTSVKEKILIYTIAYPDVLGFGYVSDVLTEENLKAVGITGVDYLDLKDKNKANEEIAGTLYTIDTLESALDDVSEPEEDDDKDKNKDKNNKRPSAGGGFVGSVVSAPKAEETEEKAPATTGAKFADIPDNHWASSDIYFLREIGVINGVTDTNFDPEGVLTREQFLKMLVLAFKVPGATGAAQFGDVDSSAWYASYVAAGCESGIANGIGNGNFGIGQTITRQDACVMLARALKLDTSAEANLDFADADSVADYAKSSVSALVEYAIINGFDDNSFRANEICSRAQAAKIVSGAITIFNSIKTGGSN